MEEPNVKLKLRFLSSKDYEGLKAHIDTDGRLMLSKGTCNRIGLNVNDGVTIATDTHSGYYLSPCESEDSFVLKSRAGYLFADTRSLFERYAGYKIMLSKSEIGHDGTWYKIKFNKKS